MVSVMTALSSGESAACTVSGRPGCSVGDLRTHVSLVRDCLD